MPWFVGQENEAPWRRSRWNASHGFDLAEPRGKERAALYYTQVHQAIFRLNAKSCVIKEAPEERLRSRLRRPLKALRAGEVERHPCHSSTVTVDGPPCCYPVLFESAWRTLSSLQYRNPARPWIPPWARIFRGGSPIEPIIRIPLASNEFR